MQRRRLALVIVAAAAFGLFAAWAKGPATDGMHAVSHARAVLGNLSAPWVLVGFLAGLQSRRIWLAALLGLFATMVALIAFYLLTNALIDLARGGYLANLRQELSANIAYLEAGLVSGLLFGALGGWWSRFRPARTSVLIGGVLMLEPIVLLLMEIALPGGALSASSGLPAVIRILPGWGLSADAGAIAIAIYSVEFAAGLVIAILGMRASRRDRERASARGIPSVA